MKNEFKQKEEHKFESVLFCQRAGRVTQLLEILGESPNISALKSCLFIYDSIQCVSVEIVAPTSISMLILIFVW